MEALSQFRKKFPSARVAVISATEDEPQVRAALGIGAVGYLPKTLLPMAMAEAIRVILDGGSYRPPK